MDDNTVDESTIVRFGEQWNRYSSNEGYYGSAECLRDIFGPLLDLSSISGQRVADIGSGSGRIVRMLFEAKALEVVALEPSEAFDVLKKNTAEFGDRLQLIKSTGDKLPAHLSVDLVLSIGVLHHIVDPGPVIRAAWKALRPGGHMLIWLYGKEGNEHYLRMAGLLRKFTTRLPPLVLEAISLILNVILDPYVLMCKYLPLPMRSYMREHVAKLDWKQRKLTIYDQLNPTYSKYYTEDEARVLLESSGFQNVRLYHRHEYSWTVLGQRPL